MITVNVTSRAISITNDTKYEEMKIYFQTEDEKSEFLRSLAKDFISND